MVNAHGHELATDIKFCNIQWDSKILYVQNSLSTSLLAVNGQVTIVIYLKVGNVYNSNVRVNHLTLL